MLVITSFYIYTHIHTHTYIQIHTGCGSWWIGAYVMRICPYDQISIYIHTYTHTHAYWLRFLTNLGICNAYMSIWSNQYTYTYIHTHTHTHTQATGYGSWRILAFVIHICIHTYRGKDTYISTCTRTGAQGQDGNAAERPEADRQTVTTTEQ